MATDQDSDSDFIRHLPHPECGSTDGASLYSDGHIYCFACDTLVQVATRGPGPLHEENEMTETAKTVEGNLAKFIDGTVTGPLKDRGITKETVKKYGVRLAVANGVPTKHYYPGYTSGGDLVAWKVRSLPKTFHVEGSLNKAGLFGQHLFPGGKGKVTLCEGELDTLASYQMRGSQWPTVGIMKGAAAAYKEVKRNFEWLNTFEEIFINFDSDEPGQKAAKEVASLFPKKAKIVGMTLKDPCEYLEKGMTERYVKDWWDAKPYRPDDILNGDGMWDIVTQERARAAFQYPWVGLNKMTYGARNSEFVVVTAGSGTGKTLFLREVAHHVFKTTPVNLGMIFLEETRWETGRGIMSMDLSKPLHLPDTHYTPAEFQAAFDRTWKTNRLYTLSDSWQDNSLDYILDKITYLVKGCDCKFIILDHISFLVSDQAGDERKMLDEIAHRLKALTVDLDVHLCAIAHTRRQTTKPLEEGGVTSLSDLRGTAGIGQLANMVYGLERDGQAEDETARNTTIVRVLKNRFSGQTGIACRLLYDEMTGRLTEVTPTEEKEVEDDILHSN